ncbi:MAG: hypothetical protein JWM27_239 [Gemmatimonadetes bacterium]|nr:hypothetical protein [Gemmatimonadota bacterium]
MIELVVVVAIMGLLAAIAWPKFDGFFAAQMPRRALDQVGADMGMARINAVRNGMRASVRFSSATAYSVTLDDPAGTRTLKSENLSAGYPGTRITPATGVYTFDSRGLKTSTTTDTIKATKNAKTVYITISPLGRVTRVY